MTLYETVVWVHILAAATWIGSMVFFAAVVVPVLRRPEVRAAAPDLLPRLGARFGRLGWLAVAVLLVTGAANLRFHEIGWARLGDRAFWATPFGRALGYKLVFVMGGLVASVVHEVATRRSGRSRAASWSGRFILLFALGALYGAVMLVRGLP
jgi:putative copper resistance protein D